MPKLLLVAMVALLGFCNVSGQFEMGKLGASVMACLKENGLSKDAMTNIMVKREFPNIKGVGCFLKCMMVRSDIMKEDGSFKTDNIKSKIPGFGKLDPEVISRIISECFVRKDDNPCENALAVANCVIKQIPSVIGT